MNNDLIVKKSSQSLLSEAIEYGLKNLVFDGSFIERMREEGAAITVRFAKKFYNANYEAYLRHVTDIVIGVCNLGVALDGENLQNTSRILRDNGLVKFFNTGIIALKDLSEDTQLNYSDIDKLSIKECAERVIAVKDVEWCGFDEYNAIREATDNRKLFLTFLDWFAAYSNIGKIQCSETDFEIELKTKLVNTGILSMIAFDAPISRLSVGDVIEIINNIENCTADALMSRIKLFQEIVPQEFMSVAQSMCQMVYKSVLRDIESQNNSVDCILREYEVNDDTDAFVRLHVGAFDNVTRDGVFEALLMVEEPDTTNVGPYIDVLLNCDVNIADISKIINEYGHWQNKIQWDRFSFEEILWLIDDVSDTSIEVVDDMFIFFSEGGDIESWNQMPIALLNLFVVNEFERVHFISEFVTLDATQISDDVSEYLVYLLDDDNCYEYCYGMAEKAQDLFEIVTEVMIANKLSEKIIIKRLTRIISNIVSGFKKEPDTIQNDKIFFDKDFRKVVKSAISEKLYKKILKSFKEE